MSDQAPGETARQIAERIVTAAILSKATDDVVWARDLTATIESALTAARAQAEQERDKAWALVTNQQLVIQQGIEALDVTEAQLQQAEQEKAKAQDGLANIQRHRDQWRGYAYGKNAKPTDFLDGNLSDRPTTRVEQLEAELSATGNRLLKATALNDPAFDRLKAERDAARAELARLTGELDAAEQHVKIARAATVEARRAALREAAEKLDAIGKGPFTGDGIIGPLHAVGLAQGYKWAAESVRALAAEEAGQ